MKKLSYFTGLILVLANCFDSMIRPNTFYDTPHVMWAVGLILYWGLSAIYWAVEEQNNKK